MKKIQALVLAAGKGTRLKAKDKPKVMYPLRDRPIIDYIVKTLKSAGFEKPLAVRMAKKSAWHGSCCLTSQKCFEKLLRCFNCFGRYAFLETRNFKKTNFFA